MIIGLFVIGILTALFNGAHVAFSELGWRDRLTYMLGGCVGVAIMVGAIYLRHVGWIA